MKKTQNGKFHFKVQTMPIPLPSSTGNSKYDWPFGTMKVGECFMFPINGTGVKATYIARGIIYRNAGMWRATGRRFVTRLMPNDADIGVWRIA